MLIMKLITSVSIRRRVALETCKYFYLHRLKYTQQHKIKNTWPYFYLTNKNKYSTNEDEAVDYGERNDDGFDMNAWGFICDLIFHYVLIAFDQVVLGMSICSFRWKMHV